MDGSPQHSFDRLLHIMDELRDQCPWDKKQTLESLRLLTLEEVYELSDAIIKKDSSLLKEELGDVLLHIVFYAKIASEDNAFNILDVINSLCDKLISRHPHIYGTLKIDNEEDVKKNWEALKMKEGRESVLSGVPAGLPSLIKAFRIQDKAAQVGFEWKHPEEVFDKVHEELNELKVAIESGNTSDMEDEFGDLFFSLINYSRYLKVDPDTALERTNNKFIKRFTYIESKAAELKLNLQDMGLQEMDKYWNEAKKM